ncbi:ubiquitin thiolesterase-like protein [Chaetomium fimeti]|uniref:ubiquitinyl hydrolase 1 n=1 Tax=Chaetomium fimeti TaxID=1854472 RepID=A0AAE0HS36_9PEZI|nr:ubiquitin thiolesterase-like protein [Chaetomium fimeti]
MEDQVENTLNEVAAPGRNGDADPLPLRRSGRARKRPSDHNEDVDYSKELPVTLPPSADTRRNPKRRAAPEAFDLPDNLLETSLGPWKEDEQAEWASWIELESDPAFFTAILGRIGVKGAKIEEVLSVDEDTLATLPSPVHGLVFLYEYVSEESAEATETSREVWFANQTTHNACATIALLNIIMNAEGLGLGKRLRELKEESKDLSPPLRGNMINNSAWIRVAHNSFARRLDLLDAALSLQNDVDAEKKKRARVAAARQKKRNQQRAKARADKSGDGSVGYHFIAFVPVGQQVWQLDGLTSTPVCIGEYEQDQHWTSVMRPVLQERMMRYETERLSFSLLALCGDNLDHVRQKLAANIRSLAELETMFRGHHHGPDSKLITTQDVIHSPTDDRLSSYQLDEEDIQAVPESELKKAPPKPQESSIPVSSASPLSPSSPSPSSPASSVTAEGDHEAMEATSKLWSELVTEQKHILVEYNNEATMAGQEPTAILGRTKDYTAAIHEWVGKLASHGALRRLHGEVRD